MWVRVTAASINGLLVSAFVRRQHGIRTVYPTTSVLVGSYVLRLDFN